MNTLSNWGGAGSIPAHELLFRKERTMKIRTLWLARDEDSILNDDQYALHEKEPKWDDELKEFISVKNSNCEFFCKKQFEKMTKIKLEPGEMQQIKIEAVGKVWTFTE